MESNYTKAGLARFLETAEKQGFFNSNTLAGMKAAFAKLLEDVKPDDDMRKVDVEAATIRYHNRNPGGLTLTSLRTYEARMKRAIAELVKYNEDPVAYKPFSRPVLKNGVARAAGKSRTAVVIEPEVTQLATEVVVPALEQRTTPTAMNMQYPLRDDFIAQVLLPRGMTSEEARRLCAFIRTLAVDFLPET